MGQNFFYIVDIFLTFHRIRMNQVRVCGNSYDRKIRITESITDLICFLFGDVASGKINVFKFQIQRTQLMPSFFARSIVSASVYG